MFKTFLLRKACALALSLLPLIVHASPTTLATPEDWRGSWYGTYICGQGITGVSLAITPSGEDSVTAVFSFYAVPQNPSIPFGEVTMTGIVGSPGHLMLFANGWITHPPGFRLIWMEGAYDPASGDYRGEVLSPGCRGFRVRRDLAS